MLSVHRRAMACRLCHQQFFPASLKFHVKVCAQRHEHVELPCDHCDESFPCTTLKVHMNFCEKRKRRARTTRGMGLRFPGSKETRRQGGVSGHGIDTPSSTAESASDQQQHPLTAASAACENGRETPVQAQDHDDSDRARQGLGGNRNGCNRREHLADGRGHDQYKDCLVGITASDGRIACTNCQRWFSSDRVGVHQDICKRVNPLSARDASKTGKDKTAGSKKAKNASSRVESRRRHSNRPVVSEKYAAVRARGARGRSAHGKKGIEGRHSIGDSRDRKCCSSDDRVWRKLAPTHAQVDIISTPRTSPTGRFLSGAENRGSSFSGSLNLEGSCPPGTEKQHQQREIQHRRRIERRYWEESSDTRRRGRRPSSATVLTSSSEDAVPLVPGKRFSVGRAVSTSCSPVRLRCDSMSMNTAATTKVPSTRNGGHTYRGSVVGSRVGRHGGGGGSEVEFAPSSKASRRGSADRGTGSEKTSGGMGFFSPSRDGARIRLLK